jgi:hypothetical protein
MARKSLARVVVLVLAGKREERQKGEEKSELGFVVQYMVVAKMHGKKLHGKRRLTNHKLFKFLLQTAAN